MKSVAIYHANNDVSEFTQRNESDATKVKNIVTPKHPMGQRVFVSFDVSPVGYLAHEFSVVV